MSEIGEMEISAEVSIKTEPAPEPAREPNPPPINPVVVAPPIEEPSTTAVIDDFSSKRETAAKTREHITSSSTRSSTRTSDYSSPKKREHDYLGDFSRTYRGTSPAVLEGIATHPLLFNKAFEPYEPQRATYVSARSRKVIRDTADLAISSPGLKALLEVQYNFLVVLI